MALKLDVDAIVAGFDWRQIFVGKLALGNRHLWPWVSWHFRHGSHAHYVRPETFPCPIHQSLHLLLRITLKLKADGNGILLDQILQDKYFSILLTLSEQVLPELYLIMRAIYDKIIEFNAITGSYFKSLYYSDGQGLNIELFLCISCGRRGITGIGEGIDGGFIVADAFL